MGRDSTTRRSVLGGAATAISASLAGCSSDTIDVLAAGSLASAIDETIGPAFAETTGRRISAEFRGSNALLTMVVEDQRRPDAIVTADARLLRERLRPNWDVVVATNAVTIAYDPDHPVDERLAAGDPWYRVLRETSARIARTDPDIDPLGYRAMQLFDLAERYYDESGLAADLAASTTVVPDEAHLLAGVETGQRAAAIAYENMANDWDLTTRSLPPALNFADPARADQYATATYTTDAGRTIPGRPVRYAAAVPASARSPAAGREFVGFLADRGDLLERAGLVADDRFPICDGTVPEEVCP